jgi:hypothetical protein
MQNLYSAAEQPDPLQNEKPAVWELVQQDFSDRWEADDVTAAALSDMKARDEWGRSKYKTPLQPFNGRDALIDFYQEVLDGAVYARQYIYEMESRNEDPADVFDVYDDLLFAIRAVRDRILFRDGK